MDDNGKLLFTITYWDYQKDETNTIFLLDWWIWFDVTRENHLVLFWACKAAQIFAAIGCIICGFRIS
ncbi:MAG: hypothetical protein AB8B80_16435 [Marinicellaceae bacterium]